MKGTNSSSSSLLIINYRRALSSTNKEFILNFQIEIGVNKFRGGAAQLYHKIGMAPAPRDPQPGQSQLQFSILNLVFPTEMQAEPGDRVEMLKTRQRTMQELREIGTFPRRFLKKQLTNDRSAPFVSGVDEWIIKMKMM